MNGPSAIKGSKLTPVRDVLGKLRTAFHAASDDPVTPAIAGVLSVFHRESHDIYKPDEVARSAATSAYRSKNPAANYAAGDRVIYPTTPAHREAIVRTGELPK
jgi:hypothetical protein